MLHKVYFWYYLYGKYYSYCTNVHTSNPTAYHATVYTNVSLVKTNIVNYCGNDYLASHSALQADVYPMEALQAGRTTQDFRGFFSMTQLNPNDPRIQSISRYFIH